MATLRKSTARFLTGIIVLIVIVGAAYSYFHFKKGLIRDSDSSLSDYSAVFISGGGVYFGKISSLTGNSMTLDDVFSYGVVNADGTTSTSNSSAQRPTIFDVSRVGIAPGKVYHFNRDQILLYYSLTSDSEVVKTILNYKANPNATPAPTATP